MLVPVPLGLVLGVVVLPGTVDDGIVVLCGTWFGVVLVPGIVLLGTLLLFGLVLCCRLPGVVVRGTPFGSVGVDGTVVGCEFGELTLPGTVVLLGTVLEGTVEGCVVVLGTVVDDGWVTLLLGFDAPGNWEGCKVLPGTLFGCVVLLGDVDCCVVLGTVAGGVLEGVLDGVVVCAKAAVAPNIVNAMIFNFKAFMILFV